MHELSDLILSQKICQGSEEAFREIYERYHIQMYFIAKKYVKDPGLAEDAVQDIFVKLWTKRQHLDESKSIKGFLFTMLRNHVLNMIRDRKKEIISCSIVQNEKPPPKNLTDDELIYNEYQEIVKKGLDELSDRKREVFELKMMGGHTNSEIADMLEINVRTVKTHYYNSSKFMKVYLKSHADITIGLICAVLISTLEKVL